MTTKQNRNVWYVVMISVRTDKVLGYLEKPVNTKLVADIVFTNRIEGGWQMAKQTANSFVHVLTALNNLKRRVRYEVRKE